VNALKAAIVLEVLDIAFAVPLTTLLNKAFLGNFWRKPVLGTSTYEYER
jgi:hypothetical protein